jgi:hypothetical protein
MFVLVSLVQSSRSVYLETFNIDNPEKVINVVLDG